MAVDFDDAVEFFGRCLQEGDGDAVGLADVVDEDGDVEGVDQGGEGVVVEGLLAEKSIARVRTGVLYLALMSAATASSLEAVRETSSVL